MVVRVRVKQIPEGSGGVSHANIWDKSNGGKEESTCIVSKMDTCIGYGKEAHVAGVQQGAEYQEMRMEKQAGGRTYRALQAKCGFKSKCGKKSVKNWIKGAMCSDLHISLCMSIFTH